MKQFVMHFSSSKRLEKTAMSLLGVRQKDGESLREYLSRFNVVCLEIVDLTMTDIVNTLIKGLKSSPLQLSLLKKTPQNIIDLLTQVEKYINLEKTLKFTIIIEIP